MLKTVLAIGGSDPCGGAGIQADIRAISSLGVHPLNVITAITLQNSNGIKGVVPISRHIIYSQINSILEETIPDAIKIGMCGSVDNALEIAEFIQARPQEIPVIVDPVITASAGGHLLAEENQSEELWKIYIEEIFPFSTIFTPNISEAKAILNHCGLSSIPNDITNLELAEELISRIYCEGIILKGGHLDSDTITDILTFKDAGKIRFKEYRSERIATKNLHGTGCVYASTMASYLALGFSIQESFSKTSERMSKIIQRSCGYELGSSEYGPLNINDYK